MKRKLISLTGFKGFTSQLHEGEALAVCIDTGEPTMTLLRNEAIFGIVDTIDASTIIGFFAIPDPTKSARHIETDDSPIITNVRRPIEDLVLAAIQMGVPAIELYYRTFSR